MTRAIAIALVLAGAACDVERTLPDAEPVAGVHPAGILDRTSSDFHGSELQRRNWDFAVCANCHGDDLRGGRAGVSCYDCHTQGPQACVTCHLGDPAHLVPVGAGGAHAQHAAVGLSCSECHVEPASWDAPGHIVDDTYPAEVTFGELARRTLDPGDRAGPPAYVNGTCENVYCHGDVLHAGGGLSSRPVWNQPGPTGGCDRCHASPPPSHARADCETCHRAAPHLDGVLEVADTCNGCHGDATSPAPPRDLSGNLFTTSIGVGAHRVHLDAPSRLRGPIPCATCHLVPATVTSPGHLDSPAPAEVDAALGWDRTTETCATAWCHGPARPRWTGDGEVVCGSCHGMPPAIAPHTPDMTLATCASCHSRSITATGTFVFDGTTSRHIDGIVDLQ